MGVCVLQSKQSIGESCQDSAAPEVTEMMHCKRRFTDPVIGGYRLCDCSRRPRAKKRIVIMIKKATGGGWLSAPIDAPVWPVEIRLAKDRRTLHVTFDDGKAFVLSAELLRVTSPSAEVQGHSEAQRKTVGGKRNVAILSVDPVGNYAVRLGFDDMHTTGIYSWPFLRDLGLNAEQRFQNYIDDLSAKGLDRDRPGVR